MNAQSKSLENIKKEIEIFGKLRENHWPNQKKDKIVENK